MNGLSAQILSLCFFVGSLALVPMALAQSTNLTRAVEQAEAAPSEVAPSGGAAFMTDAQLFKAFSSTTHIGAYRRYLAIYGAQQFTETYNADGTLDYEANGVVSKGVWEIRENQICFDYFNPDFLPGCFYVVEAEGCYYSYEAYETRPKPVAGRDPWWIRSYVEGTEPECATSELVS